MQDDCPIIAFVPREVFSMTRGSLGRLLEKTDGSYRLVCVDGNSPPDVRDYLKDQARELGFTLLRTEEYLSPNQARNIAVKWTQSNANAEYIVFVDNDVLVSDDWFAPLLRCAEETGAGVVAPVYFEHLPECSVIHMFGGRCGIEKDVEGRLTYMEAHDCQHLAVADLEEPLVRTQTQLVEFHVVMARMELFDKIGLLDEGLLCHAEHGDFSMLATQAGYTIWVEPESQVTYVPPKRLQPSDREYFFLRWSDAWTRLNQRQFKKKWNLEHIENDHGRGIEWVRMHRRFGYHWLKRLRKLFGRKRSRFIIEKIVMPLEPKWNQMRYPISKYASPREIQVEEFRRSV